MALLSFLDSKIRQKQNQDNQQQQEEEQQRETIPTTSNAFLEQRSSSQKILISTKKGVPEFSPPSLSLSSSLPLPSSPSPFCSSNLSSSFSPNTHSSPINIITTKEEEPATSQQTGTQDKKGAEEPDTGTTPMNSESTILDQLPMAVSESPPLPPPQVAFDYNQRRKRGNQKRKIERIKRMKKKRKAKMMKAHKSGSPNNKKTAINNEAKKLRESESENGK